MSEEMFQEALRAARAGQRARAKDLLGRLLRTEPNNLDYWLWMSAVVETQKEQIFCLQKAVKIDPNSVAARRGLVMLGAMSPEEAALPPPIQLEGAAVSLPGLHGGGNLQDWLSRPRNRQLALIGGLGMSALVVVLIVFFAFLAPRLFPGRQVVVVTSTPTASHTPLPVTLSPEVPSTATATNVPCSLPVSPNPATPIAAYLCLTQTPAPFPLATERSLSEDFNSLVKAYGAQDWERVLQRGDVLVNDPGFADNARLYFYLAEAQRHTGRLTDALRNYRTAIGRDATLAVAYWGRAQAEFAQNRQAEALKDLEAAIEADPGLYLPYLDRAAYFGTYASNHARAVADLQAAQVAAPQNALVLARLALSLMDNGQPAEAQPVADEALALDAGQALAYYARGRARLAAGEAAGAALDLDLAAVYMLDPSVFARTFPVLEALDLKKYYQSQVLYHAGLARAAIGDDQAAMEYFSQAIVLHGRSPLAYLERGEVHLRALDFDQARSDFNNAIDQFKQVDPNNPALNRAYLGNGLALLGLDRPEGALSNFQVAVRGDPQNFAAQLGLGRALAGSGEADQSLAVFETALALAQSDSQRGQVLYWRAQAHRALGAPAAEAADLAQLAALAAGAGDLAATAVARLTEIGPLNTATSPPTATVRATSVLPTATRVLAATATGSAPTPTASRTPTATVPPAPARPTATPTPGGYPGPGATSSP